MDFDCRLGTLVTSYTTHLFDPHISSEPLTDMNITIIIIIFIIIIPIITVTNICLIGLLINSACGGNNSILQMVKVTTIVIIINHDQGDGNFGNFWDRQFFTKDRHV